jgi:hypothetical protein
VILYHFTSLYNLQNVGPDNIMAVGLKAFPFDWIDLMGRQGVWLTTDPDLPGGLCAHHEARIKLLIASSDRRLIHLPKLLRRLEPWEIENLDTTSAEVGGNWRSFFIYEADIPPSHFRAVEFADPAKREQAAMELAEAA